MNRNANDYLLLETDLKLQEFYDLNKNTPWLSFDTEFIGERRYHTRICLIQVASPNGIYLIDSVKIKNLQPLLDLIQDKSILKITHAGENDYRLLFNQNDITPKNVFDTQIAAAFIGYKYPVSFRKLLESELGISVGKGFTVADWESRPLKAKQIRYAVQDVLYLHELWLKMSAKLKENKRYEWAMDECSELEKEEYYIIHPDREAFMNTFIKNLSEKEQIFLLRLYRWRRSEAKRKNYSKEMILPAKYFNQITRVIPGGLDAMTQHRRIPDKMVQRYGQLFIDLYNKEASEEEMGILELIPVENTENPRQDLLTEMLDMLIKFKCLDENLSHDLVLPRGLLKRMKADANYWSPMIEKGWRRSFLGEELTSWLKNRKLLKLNFGNGKLELKLEQ